MRGLTQFVCISDLTIRVTASGSTSCPFKMKSEGTKKRKRDGESSGKPKKKVVLDVPASAASVSSVLRSETCPPVVGKKLDDFC